MHALHVLATKLPLDVTKTLDQVCKRFGLRKNFVVESALREKLEDILDAYDLQEAEKEGATFYNWDDVKRELKKKGLI